MSNPGTEVATTGEQRAPIALTGRQNDFDATYRLAKNLSVSGIIPRDLQGKPADVLVIVLYGQELGLAPMQALQVIDVVKGRPSLRANLWVALARKAGHKVRVVENSATSTSVTVIRNDDPDGPITATYTIDDAKQAGLTSNDNYRKNPKAMLYARAASTAIRQACPEVALGFSDEYELAEPDPAPARPTLAQVAAERTDRQQPAAALGVTVAEATGQTEPAPVEPDPVPSADEYAALEAEFAETVEPDGGFSFPEEQP